MNSVDRRAYSLTSQRQQARIEGRHVKPIYQALRITVDDFLADARAKGLTYATGRLYTVINNPALATQLQEVHEEAGLFFGRKAYREIARSARVEKAGFGFNLQWAADIISYFTRDLFQLVQDITDTTRNQILDVLSRATNEGQSFEWIENELTSPELVAFRARLIARTEVAKAAFVGRKLANRDTEWETEKEWISAHDKRTRPGHAKVDGELIDTDAKFQVSYPKGVDMMEGPGDPSANIANIAQCRCSLAYKAARDANGRLIRKQPALTAQLT